MGGWSSIEATILLLKSAINNTDIQRFVLLQGLEYPIESNQYINDFFEKNKNIEFIKAQNISDSNNYKDTHKYRLYWNLDNTSVFNKLFMKMNSLLFLKTKWIPKFKKNYVIDNTGNRNMIFQGCAQFGITRELAQYIIDYYDTNPNFNKYFKTMYAPDEAYFHTIVYNSNFKYKTKDGKAITRNELNEYCNLTYFEYPKQIRIFKYASEYQLLKGRECLFFRKANSESKELLDYIDQLHKNEVTID